MNTSISLRFIIFFLIIKVPQRSPSPRLASAVVNAVASPIQKIVTPRHRNSVRKNGPNSATGAADKKHSKSRDANSALVSRIEKIYCLSVDQPQCKIIVKINCD